MRSLWVRTDHRQQDNYGGLGYYRSILPAAEIGGETIGKPHNNEGDFWQKKLPQYDVVFTKSIDNPFLVAQFLDTCHQANIPLILDFDDDYTALDTPPTFNYPVGSPQHSAIQLLMEECTAITVSTKPLLEAYSWLKKPLHLVPNVCRPSDWPEIAPGRTKDPRIVIGWTGSLSHVLEYDMVTEICLRSYEKYGDKILFGFLGLLPTPVKEKLPRHAWYCNHGAGQWEGYPKILAEQHFDIGIAPLKHTQFNNARSAIKWMEYTLTGTPTVASNWGEYPNYKGLLLANNVGEFVTHISTLIENPNERRKLVAESRTNLPTSAGWGQVCSRYAGNGFRPASDSTKTS